MQVLIAYASTEGQTRKIAEHVAGHLRTGGHEVTIYDCAHNPLEQDFDRHDAYIVAGSVHQAHHQERLVAFVRAHRAQLEAKPSAFLSVSLSAAFSDDASEVESYIDGFVDASGWRPAEVLAVAGALRFSEYDFFKEQIIRHLVMRDRDLPSGPGNFEFTDWDALDTFIDRFTSSATAS